MHEFGVALRSHSDDVVQGVIEVSGLVIVTVGKQR